MDENNKHLRQVLKERDKEPLSMLEKDGIWERIESEAKFKPHPRKNWWLKIAASVFVVAGIYDLLYMAPIFMNDDFLEAETFSGRLGMQMDINSVLNVLSVSSKSKITNTERGIMIQK